MIFDYFDKKKRARLREQPFPDEWHKLLDRNVPYVKLLSPEERKELEGLIHVFLGEKSFEGCGGLELTDEIRVTIAAQACQLLLGRDVEPYPGIDVILVYPSAYKGQFTNSSDGVVIEGDTTRLGEASTRGILVLSRTRSITRTVRATARRRSPAARTTRRGPACSAPSTRS
jgi:Mlc titration factor MtfA (ptsG expression regulator)